ncbi:MAG: hypothetical protein ACPG6B_10260, partial [Oceanihabitans sp.]
NKKDQIAIGGFLNRIACGLNYATHELPDYGLLWDLAYFTKELKKFKSMHEKYSNKEIWNKRVTHWEFVLKTWTEYIDNKNDFSNYKAFLNAKNLKYIQ